jgi:hypothetical protein
VIAIGDQQLTIATWLSLGSLKSLGINLYSFIPIRIFIYIIWCVGFLTIRMIAHQNRLQLSLIIANAEARKHELAHLQAQMNPHFLFNALNAVLANKDDPEAVELVTENLAAFLRFSLQKAEVLEPFARELDSLHHYLIVQQARFGENLEFQIRAEQMTRPIMVPPMIVQPILENAVHYGYQTCEKPLRVLLNAFVIEDYLVITISNNGSWVTPDSHDSNNTGIRTLRQRLKLLMGGLSSVDIMKDPGWVRVVIRIPLVNATDLELDNTQMNNEANNYVLDPAN